MRQLVQPYWTQACIRSDSKSMLGKAFHVPRLRCRDTLKECNHLSEAGVVIEYAL